MTRATRLPSDPELARIYSRHVLNVMREQQVLYAMSLQGVTSLAALMLLGYAIYKGTVDLTVVGAAAANIVATVGFHAWKCRARSGSG